MSDKHIEKIFLYLLAISLLLHVAVFAFFILFPQEKNPPKQEPYMVELRDLPEVKAPPPQEQKKTSRLAEKQRRVPKEIAPKGEREVERLAPPLQPPVAKPGQQATREEIRIPQRQERGIIPREEAPRGESVFKPNRQEQPSLAKLFPSSGKMAKIEENYRKKYGPEVEDGEASFLNTDDILFGSFLRRFETAVYGVWRYPQEAARHGIQGVTPVRITFNRKGEVVDVKLLESSGSRILDEEVLRTLREIGRIGSFPRGYTKDTFKLIAFFQYINSSSGIRGSLH
ncbi:periplasmic energy transduction protein, TonB-related [Geotalea daltonii FRC-32]|uniref:Periplasmic energy transduction protein, TonB-related n=1 Tax=Geotalea daltonii (strain DSM 22248 / JCM 15807 / FRC-32) TaxID=316067 RepID=B9M773_GEODF|nr:energy transducer TonB [Geotalea daltonii]ACM20161.1 periplasmic energy transduction protein, TonB-related [Geotalea daltonii FRC-32]